jgi:hypothetical protein
MVFALSLFNKKKTELKPYIEKQRHPCPFYGFNGSFGMMVDQEGNQCALLTNSYSPCRMEVNKQTPNYSKCSFNNEENNKALEKIANKMQIFPREFSPPNQKSWDGIKLRQWMDYLLKKNSKSN